MLIYNYIICPKFSVFILENKLYGSTRNQSLIYLVPPSPPIIMLFWFQTVQKIIYNSLDIIKLMRDLTCLNWKTKNYRRKKYSRKISMFFMLSTSLVGCIQTEVKYQNQLMESPRTEYSLWVKFSYIEACWITERTFHSLLWGFSHSFGYHCLQADPSEIVISGEYIHSGMKINYTGSMFPFMVDFSNR